MNDPKKKTFETFNFYEVYLKVLFFSHRNKFFLLKHDRHTRLSHFLFFVIVVINKIVRNFLSLSFKFQI